MSTYVYGIARAGELSLPEDLDGVGDPARPVLVLEQDGLAALVSDAPEGLRPQRRDLIAHQHVLAEAGAATTVLPMRFGTLADDDARVVAVLDERAEHFRERLDTLRGKTEYNVKASHDEEQVLRRVLADDPELREANDALRGAEGGTHDQRLRFGAVLAQAVQNREGADEGIVRETLVPVAEAVSEGPGSAGWLANLSFLVPADAAGDFLAAVEHLRRDHPHLELRLNGPLPPYSFVEPYPVTNAAAAAPS